MARIVLLAAVLCYLACAIHAVQYQHQEDRRQICQAPTTAPKKLELIIEQCQEEIKEAIFEEAVEALRGSSSVVGSPNRSKRETFTGEEKRIAGVDENGLPTASGLVKLYSEGVQDRNYFIATLQAVQQCINLAEQRRAYNLAALRDGGYTCDLAYDMFNCVSDRIEHICGSSP